MLEKTTTSDNSVRRTTILELNALRDQLRKMKYGSPSKNDDFQVFTPFDKAPEIGIQYLRKYREVEIQSKLLELLLPLFEQAKIEEQRNTPSVIVLDTAVPATKPSKPKRLLILALAAFGSLLIASLIAFALEHLKQGQLGQSQDHREKIDFVRSAFHYKSLFR